MRWQALLWDAAVPGVGTGQLPKWRMTIEGLARDGAKTERTCTEIAVVDDPFCAFPA